MLFHKRKAIRRAYRVSISNGNHFFFVEQVVHSSSAHHTHSRCDPISTNEISRKKIHLMFAIHENSYLLQSSNTYLRYVVCAIPLSINYKNEWTEFRETLIMHEFCECFDFRWKNVYKQNPVEFTQFILPT